MSWLVACSLCCVVVASTHQANVALAFVAPAGLKEVQAALGSQVQCSTGQLCVRASGIALFASLPAVLHA
jgi:hypothetical protein